MTQQPGLNQRPHGAVTDPLMHIRTRKLIGTIALVVFLAVYALAAMLVAVALQVNASKTAELAYYIIAGLAWTVPAGAIIYWMQRP